MTGIVNISLTGENEQAIRVAITLIEYALLEVAQVSPPRPSTRRKYKGSSLARGTMRVPLDDAEIRALAERIRARLGAVPAATGQTRKL